MKKIGKEVAFWATGENNPRNGECDFCKKKSNVIGLFIIPLFTFRLFDGKILKERRR